MKISRSRNCRAYGVINHGDTQNMLKKALNKMRANAEAEKEHYVGAPEECTMLSAARIRLYPPTTLVVTWSPLSNLIPGVSVNFHLE
jgi:hypothetical protein